MITKIELTNFKSHAHTVIEPGRVTALVGPNGCGKTSVLQAIYYLSLLNDKDNGFVKFRDEATISDLVKQGKPKGKVKACGHNKSVWEFAASFSSIPDQIDLGLEWKWNKGALHTGSGITTQSVEDQKLVSKAFGESIYFKGISQNLSATSYSEDIPPKITSDGKGLATVIAYLMLTVSEHHIAIETSLREIVPTVLRVRVRPALVKLTEKKMLSINGAQIPYDDPRGVMGHEIIFDTTNAKELPAQAMSDGTLLVLGLLTLLYSPSAPQLILLDDIEAGLHPLAQRQLMQTLKDFAEKHDRQIILTSHSPYIIDELNAKDVWVMAPDKEGVTHTKRLSDHPEAEKVLSVLSTGEFASALDEEWVLGETHSAELVHG